ncbi:uncharacterized protein DEA37_0011724 [Paragonimus westermani]|uniref:Uncharacterized protein n=1 Tax=Paragonimus westermani TaxID=34504 RepID=A0A5J4P3U3_9TREM|nr:uncharacterized protein DEA37_0011724 [Paragonimus westermani]
MDRQSSAIRFTREGDQSMSKRTPVDRSDKGRTVTSIHVARRHKRGLAGKRRRNADPPRSSKPVRSPSTLPNGSVESKLNKKRRNCATEGADSLPPISLKSVAPNPSNRCSPASSVLSGSNETTDPYEFAVKADQEGDDRTGTSGLPRPSLRPRMRINTDAFHVGTLKEIGQQAALARTLNLLNVDVCCISKTRIQGSGQRVELTARTLSTRYWLYTSGDSTIAVTRQAGWLGHVLSMPVDRLPYLALYTGTPNSLLEPRGGQATTWSRNISSNNVVTKYEDPDRLLD